MELLLLIFLQAFYIPLKELISVVNIFAIIQGYAVVKRQTKKSKKDILQKTVLIYNENKVYIDKKRFAKDIILHKYDCLFDMVTLIKDNTQVLQVKKVGYNHELILLGTYLIYKKAVMT